MTDQVSALELLDRLVASGIRQFSFDEAVHRSGRSRTATANLLRRMMSHGLLDRVCRGHYVIRELGALGTDVAAEDVPLAVGAAFAGRKHRIGYGTALEQHGLLAAPQATIQVASTHRMRITKLSSRALRVIFERDAAIAVGAAALGDSMVSDLERALLDAAARPELVGGAAVLVAAVKAASRRANANRLMEYAERIGWWAALRRLGSLADALEVEGLASSIEPVCAIKGDISLEPGLHDTLWRDARWRVRWSMTRDAVRHA